MIACWIGYSDDALTHYGLLAQRLDYYGNAQWDANGVFVSTSSLIKAPMMIFDGGSSGCNIAWADGRTFGASGYDVYAQHVKSNANLGNRINPNTTGSKVAEVKQNYPNPFNPATNISFNISQSGFVSLKIYDMTGREVAVLANGTYEPGEYSVTWNAANFATGAYLYKFTANGNTEIKTMMLIK
jgi:prepilin-type processing-associated H-X9-DG protein